MPFRNAGTSNVVGFVDDHDIPVRFLKEVLITADVLQRVDADNDAVIDFKRVLVRRDSQPQFGDASGIESDQRQREPVPQLRLKLRQHRLLREHQDAIGPAPAHQFSQDHADLDRLSQPDRIGQQQSRTQLLECQRHRIDLILHGLERTQPLQIRLDPRGRHLAKLCLEK